jgi:hypothetical protein
MKNFPIPIQKILPAVILGGAAIAFFSGGHTSPIAPVEASTTRNPVVAPAGTVLRVRMNQALDAGHSRPGDRFEGVLDAPVMVGTVEVLVKGTPVFGHVIAAGRSESGPEGRVVLALTLDSCELPGREIAISTSPVTRASGSRRVDMGSMGWKFAKTGEQRVSVAAESIMGFTLTGTLTA